MSFIEDIRWMHSFSNSSPVPLPPWVHEAKRRDAGGEHPALLYLEDVEVVFSGFKALDIKTFYVNRGELRFLIGPNGAGKTTLLDVVCRKTEARSGRVLFDGQHDLSDYDIPAVARLGISRKFQTPSIFSASTVWQNMELAYPRARSVFSGLHFSLAASEKADISRILELTGLEAYATNLAQTLSHGQKQWLEIALTLLQKPRLLLVDEPVAGMSEAERYATGLLLQELAKDCAVLVVEHDMNFVKTFSKTVSVLHEGRILCEGIFEKVSKDPQVLEVYLGRGTQEAELVTETGTGSGKGI